MWFLQINECEGLQETINSLKKQLSDARSEFNAEKDARIMLLRQAQVHSHINACIFMLKKKTAFETYLKSGNVINRNQILPMF